MATKLRDIADRVGVSISTVSLVLNGHDHGRVSPRLASIIRAVAEDMEYLPNLLGRALKIGQSKTIGVLAEGIASSPLGGEMLAGAQEAAWERGYFIVVIDIGQQENLMKPAMQALLQRHIQSLIVATDYHRKIDIPMSGLNIPRVLLNASPAVSQNIYDDGPVNWVVPDEEAGAYAAVRHLIKCGHRRIAWCGVSDTRYVAADLRFQGYRRALEESGIDYDPSLTVMASGPCTLDGVVASEQLMSMKVPPTAVSCFSDRLAMAIYEVMHERGLNVPADLSIVGFDNQTDIANALRPGLSTIHLPYREMGRCAVHLALNCLEGSNDPLVLGGKLIECPLVTRGSVATNSNCLSNRISTVYATF